jgi:hypothetical protein
MRWMHFITDLIAVLFQPHLYMAEHLSSLATTTVVDVDAVMDSRR